MMFEVQSKMAAAPRVYFTADCSSAYFKMTAVKKKENMMPCYFITSGIICQCILSCACHTADMAAEYSLA